MNDDTERQLLEYLREQKVADVSGAVRSIADWTQQHAKDDAVRHEELRGEMRGHSLRIGALEKNDEKLDDRLEKSGSWQMESERARAIVATAHAAWWKDKALAIVVGLVMLALGTVGTILLKK